MAARSGALGVGSDATRVALLALRRRVVFEAGLVGGATLALVLLDVRLDLVTRVVRLDRRSGLPVRHLLFLLAVSHLLMLVFGARRARELRAAAGQRAAAQAELQHRADHDALTDLPNRAVLDRAVVAALVPSGAAGPGLLRLSLRDLPEIGATLGHAVRDQVLRSVVRLVAGALAAAPGALVASVGGAELAVLVPPGVNPAALAAVLLAAVHPGVDVDDMHLELPAHVGIAVVAGPDLTSPDLTSPDLTSPDLTSAELLGRAEVALAAAIAQGVPSVAYDPRIDRRDSRRLTLYGELRRGIDAGQLRVHYQPKVSLGTGAVSGLEALVRWEHPQRGLLPPSEFLDVAEHSGLIPALTEAVLDRALSDHAAWAASGLVLPVAVNLSARSLLDPALTASVVGLVRAHGLAPGVLELEVTEGAVMADPERACATLQRLRDEGFALAVDDYGTGQASLRYLSRLPITTLKIDRAFVSGLERRPEDRTIVHSTIDLGHGLGFTVVAEGIETEEVWRRLGSLGCDEAQGYWLGHPGPAADVLGAAASIAARLAAEPQGLPRQRAASA